MPHYYTQSPSTFLRLALRLSTVVLAIIIVTTIENVEGKGGIARGGIFRSSSRGVGFGGRYGSTGGGSGYFGGGGLRPRWWMIGAIGCKDDILLFHANYVQLAWMSAYFIHRRNSQRPSVRTE